MAGSLRLCSRRFGRPYLQTLRPTETDRRCAWRALKALAGAAASGAATYALRKALASRNGHDDSDPEEGQKDESKRPTVDDAAEDESDDGDGDADEFREDSVEDDDEYPTASADDDVEDDDDDSDEPTAGSADRAGRLRQLVTPARLASASQLLLPLAEEAASSAGRYVGDHAPETVREQILPRFIDAFEEAT